MPMPSRGSRRARPLFRPVAALTAAILLVGVAGAQVPSSAPSGASPGGPSPAGAPLRPAADTAGPDAAGLLRVFFDCQSFNCREFDYVRTEIPWVNWMRDRFDSQVHVLVTSVRNGANGLAFVVAVIGRGRWEGQVDTLRLSTLPNDADEVVRRKLVQVIRVGLVRYAAQTAVLSRLSVGIVGPPPAPPSPKAVRDPWDFWIFTVGADGSANLESRQDEERLGVSATATRVTEAWRVGFGMTGSYLGRAFQLSANAPRAEFVNRTYDASLYAVRSLGPRWSAGALANVGYSDFLNEALLVRLQPAIEYNVFPWAEVVRRQLSVMYAVGPVYYQWQRPTIFGVERAELRPQQKLIVTLAQRQTWGTVTLALQGQQYLHDLGKYNLSLGGFTSLRLGRGLQVNLNGQVARVRDQIYLAAGGLTEEQILVRQQALATNYTVRFNLGLSYTFGSIYNTVVNRRLDALLGFGRGLGGPMGGGGGGGPR